MSSWVALNVEPDEAVEEEVDDTKELQIEEALKLYHAALKLHSQGPEHYSQAAEAYEALLNSSNTQSRSLISKGVHSTMRKMNLLQNQSSSSTSTTLPLVYSKRFICPIKTTANLSSIQYRTPCEPRRRPPNQSRKHKGN